MNGRNKCFIILKGFKRFQQSQRSLTKPKLNPDKTELGRISRSILNRINTSQINLVKVNQRKYTSEINE